LAIIPTGSGNGLARHLNIPIDLKKSILLLNAYQTKLIDTVKINDYNFLGTAGIGFDAHVGWKFSEAKRRGFLSYIKIAIKEYFNYAEEEYTIKIDEDQYHLKAMLITFANSNQYGNNAIVSPNSVIDDGYLRLIILKRFSLFYAPKFIYLLFNKKLDKFKYYQEFKGKNIQINTNKDEIHIDGEPLKMNSPINLAIIPKSLKIIVP